MKITFSLLRLADNFDKAERIGNEKDDPEGSRHIIISDTLARKISEELRYYLKKECRNCNFYSGIRCQRKSPITIIDPIYKNVDTCWPQVHDDHYCGEFEHKIMHEIENK